MEIPTLDFDGVTSLASTVFKLIEQNKQLQKRVTELEGRLEISRKLQQKPKLYEPGFDPYFGEEDGS